MYCFHCKFFVNNDNQNSSFTDGSRDLKNASAKIADHERSKTHMQAIGFIIYKNANRFETDKVLEMQVKEEASYWKAVLSRIVETIKFISEPGLAFRGQDEEIGSPLNGNYLGILELIAKFNSFLAQHTGKQKTLQTDGKDKRSISYLSSTICDELIAIRGRGLLETIIEEIKKFQYQLIPLHIHQW